MLGMRTSSLGSGINRCQEIILDVTNVDLFQHTSSVGDVRASSSRGQVSQHILDLRQMGLYLGGCSAAQIFDSDFCQVDTGIVERIATTAVTIKIRHEIIHLVS